MRLLSTTLASAAESKDINLDNIKQALLRVQTSVRCPAFPSSTWELKRWTGVSQLHISDAIKHECWILERIAKETESVIVAVK